jgi:hypothetical protein
VGQTSALLAAAIADLLHSRNAMTSSPFGRNSAQLSFDRFSSKGASICNLVREIIRPGKGNRIVIHRLYF